MDKSLNFWIFLVIVYFFYIARKETTKGKSLSPSKPVIKDVIKNCVEPFEKGSRKPYDPVECVQQNLDEGSMLGLGTKGCEVVALQQSLNRQLGTSEAGYNGSLFLATDGYFGCHTQTILYNMYGINKVRYGTLPSEHRSGIRINETNN